jgi:hypothetical protein
VTTPSRPRLHPELSAELRHELSAECWCNPEVVDYSEEETMRPWPMDVSTSALVILAVVAIVALIHYW